jgi:mannose-1-phosphate guanylyltransferase
MERGSLSCARGWHGGAASGEIGTFGVAPDDPATGHGYVHPGEPLAVDPQVRRVERAFIKDGYLWNSGSPPSRSAIRISEHDSFITSPLSRASRTARHGYRKRHTRLRHLPRPDGAATILERSPERLAQIEREKGRRRNPVY